MESPKLSCICLQETYYGLQIIMENENLYPSIDELISFLVFKDSVLFIYSIIDESYLITTNQLSLNSYFAYERFR